MKIDNPTHWSTGDIRRLIYRVSLDELERGQLVHARIRIKYARKNGRALGRCTYGTPRNPRVNMMLVMPRPGTPVDLVQLAKVIAHELGHAKGLRHRQMRNNRYGWVEGWRGRYAYALDFPIATEGGQGFRLINMSELVAVQVGDEVFESSDE